MRQAPRFALAWLVPACVFAYAACETSAPTGPTWINAIPVPVSALVTIAESSTIAEVTAGSGATGGNYPGQSVTVPAGPDFNNIRFNWDGNGLPGLQPIAGGVLFIVTKEYLGMPGNLGSSTPGFLAQSQSIEEGQYVFTPSVTLKGSTKYWFYAYWPPGSAGGFQWVDSFCEDIFAGGDEYIAPVLAAPTPSLPFRKTPASWRLIAPGQYIIPPPGTYTDANFRLVGAPLR